MQKISVLTLTVASTVAIVANRFITLDGAVPAAGGVAFGIADQGASGPGKLVPVDVIGTSKLETGGAFAAGTILKCDALGRGIAQGGAGEVLARALQPSGAAGLTVEVLLLPSRS